MKVDISITDEVADILRKEVSNKEILEIGTYHGYSASIMLEAGAKKVVTIEKDAGRAEEAKKNLAGKNAEVIVGDATEILENMKESFDVVFIDGPKNQYPKHFMLAKKLLREEGVIIMDNVDYHFYLEIAANGRALIARRKKNEKEA